MVHCHHVYRSCFILWWLYLNFKKVHSKLVTHYFQHKTCNLNRVRNGYTMVTKPGTIFLIMKMASKVGPILSCFCMKFLASNNFGGRLSAKPASLTVGYLRTRTRIYKSREYCRGITSGNTLDIPQVYKHPLAQRPRERIFVTGTNKASWKETNKPKWSNQIQNWIQLNPNKSDQKEQLSQMQFHILGILPLKKCGRQGKPLYYT